jgi:hypothetical protein
MERYRSILFLALLIGGGIVFECVSTLRQNPAGHASTLKEYLQWRPTASQFGTVDVQGKQHIIAYGRASGLLASGPPAYVFDDTGQLVDWSADIGDDPQFDERWNAQRLHREVLSRAQVEQRANTPPAH